MPSSITEGDSLGRVRALSRALASMAVKGAGRSEVSHVGDVSSACFAVCRVVVQTSWIERAF